MALLGFRVLVLRVFGVLGNRVERLGHIVKIVSGALDLGELRVASWVTLV